jgi:hypothetical protein
VEQSQLGTQLILPDFVLPSRVNQHWQYSGIDSQKDCRDKKHFEQYPHNINYQYNSRGFRDQEWPDTVDQLKQAIWCVGDSFTVGIGSPVEHTWPNVLQQSTQKRIINVSMDGASNNWISRKILKILTEVEPELIVVHWSYLQRRERSIDEAQLRWWQNYYNNVKDFSWPHCPTPGDFFYLPEHIQDELKTNQAPGPFYQINDEDRRLQYDELKNISEDQDMLNTIECIKIVESQAKNTKILHSFIPNYILPNLQINFENQISSLVKYFVGEITAIDRARDGHHYDIKTSQAFVHQIHRCLNQMVAI